MEINSNFDEIAIVHAQKLDWIPSPMAGVDRRMLDRLGDEVARATSIVRYAPDSAFSPHVHTGGEEFLVLEGVFQDEHGDFPVGSYIRNPPQSSHTPSSKAGCVIFVKLWQFDMDDRKHVRVNIDETEFSKDKTRTNVEVMPLYDDAHEHVSIERWAHNTSLEIGHPDGLEILVLDGSYVSGDEGFETQSWTRLPRDKSISIDVGSNGAKVWIKRGHLAETPKAPVS